MKRGILLVFVILLLGMVGATDVSTCGTLTGPDNFTLDADLQGNATGDACLEINANIGTTVVDCAGYQVRGIDAAALSIKVNLLDGNLTIKNCDLTGYDDTLEIQILSSGDSDNFTVTNTSFGNSLTGIDIGGTAVKAYFSNNTFNNLTTGISIAATNYDIYGNRIATCTTGLRVTSQTGQTNKVYNNFFNNSVNLVINSTAAGFTQFNISKTLLTNVLGGSYIGGNYWANYTGTGISQTCVNDGDGFCTTSEEINSTTYDYLPMTLVVVDTTFPLVENILPSLSSVWNISQNIIIGANISDDVAVDARSVNVTYPNSTVSSYTLSDPSGNWSQYIFTSNLIGVYNVTFYANDSSGNLNGTETTNFTIVDLVKPNVTGYLPAVDTEFTQDDVIQIGVNVTDNGYVGAVLINLTYPNASVSSLSLSNTGDWYNTSFTVSVAGNYNVTFVANDTGGNLNSSISTNFTVVAAAVTSSTSSGSGGGGGTAGGVVTEENVTVEEEEVVEDLVEDEEEVIVEEEDEVNYIQRAAQVAEEKGLLNYAYMFGAVGLVLLFISLGMFVKRRM